MIKITRYRLIHYKNILAVILLGMCLATGFFALQSLYLHQVSEATARTVVDDTRQERLNLTLRNPQPFDPQVDNVLQSEVGNLIQASYRYVRTTGYPSSPTFDQICGYTITEDNTLQYAPRTSDHCYTLYAFQELTDLFTVTEGTFPATVSDQPEDGFALVEGVLSNEIAINTGIHVGDELIIGDDLEKAIRVKIVGLVDPVFDESYELWNGNHGVLSGLWTPVGDDRRYDFGLIVPLEDYDAHIIQLAPTVSYLLWSEIDGQRLDAATLEILDEKLDILTGQTLLVHPEINITTGLRAVVEDYKDKLSSLETPILALSSGILVLLLYNLVTTAGLILDQQKTEWSAYALRGASVRQLLLIQFMTMGLLGIIAGILGPWVGAAILSGMNTLGAVNLPHEASILSGISPRTFALSFVAAAAAVLVLTAQAYPVAKNSLSQVKTFASRPNTTPVWMQYYLDVILIVIGIGFLLRLYFLISGDLGDSLRELINDPSYLVRIIAAEGQNSQENRGLLDDPFNLIAPLLLLTGIALVWLRIFPFLMRLFNWLWRRQDSLPITLALWNVERNPNHYAQLVLMLIGILALGTASLSLGATHDRGAWDIAQKDVGADVVIRFDRVSAENIDWSMPEVIATETVMRLDTRQQVSTTEASVLGVDAASSSIAAFNELPEFLPGIPLPTDTVEVQLDVFSQAASDTPTQTVINLQLVSNLGMPISIRMTTPNDLLEGKFMTYTADLTTIPEEYTGQTWLISGVRFFTRRGEDTVIPHTAFLDNLRAINTTGEEVVVEDFETETNLWNGAIGDRNAPVISYVQTHSTTGEKSLQLLYTARTERLAQVDPLLVVNQPNTSVPVIISKDFAEANAGRGGTPLETGSTGVAQLDLTFGVTRLPYVVVGVVDAFPPLTGDFMIVPFDRLVYVLNANNPPGRVYDQNEVWIELQNDEPSSTFREEVQSLAGFENAQFAWDRYQILKQDPLINAITGVLFAGFWVALGLGALDFAFYLTLTVRQRAVSFAVLRAMGWQKIWNVLLAEQIALVTPALVVGVSLGILLAYLLLPFLTLIGNHPLQLPLLTLLVLVTVFVGVFSFILGVTSRQVGQTPINDILRKEEMQI